MEKNEKIILSVIASFQRYGYGFAISMFLVAYSIFVSLNLPTFLQSLNDFWAVSVTMILGSFVAGSTSLGGGAVAFPVLSKILGVDVMSAKQFSLLIQSVGMGLASVAIFSFGKPAFLRFLKQYLWGSLIGVLLGLLLFNWNVMVLRILLTTLFLIFGLSYSISFFRQNHLDPVQHIFNSRELKVQFALGLIAGVMTSQLGSGADMLLFIVCMLRYRLPVKQVVPITVIVMAINAIWGSVCTLVLGQMQPDVMGMWLAAMPVVAFGAPLGAWFMRKVSKQIILALTYLLILAECITTVWRFEWVLFELYYVIGSVAFSIIFLFSLDKYKGLGQGICDSKGIAKNHVAQQRIQS